MSVLASVLHPNFKTSQIRGSMGIGLVYAQAGSIQGELWFICTEPMPLKCSMMVTIGAANRTSGRICPNAQEFSLLGPVLLVSIRRPIPQARAKMSQ